MRILMVAPEALPFAKTGGLADVVRALPRALARRGHQVDVVMPRYRGVPAGERPARLTVPMGRQRSDAGVHALAVDGVRMVFIDHPVYFQRDELYGAGGQDYADNPERFAFLSRAALLWAAEQPRYDVVHAHDWQTGLVPLLMLRDFSTHRALAGVPTVFTVHNLAYQGICDASWLPRLGLGWDLLHVDALEFWGRISFLKAGITFCRTVTTVSPRYAREIQTPELGFGFDGIFRHRAADLVGIANGIDYDQWNPATDVHLPQPYQASNLAGKRGAKQALLREMGLPADEAALDVPLVGMVSRMVGQKGHDLLAELADELPRLGARFVVMGSGDRRYEDFWLALSVRCPDRVAARVKYDEGRAHRIIAGADMFLMPSRFEPCGLTQMYSQRYGTLPLVHATGGLHDTVRNLDVGTGAGSGFAFDDYSAQALLGTLRWALGVYTDRGLWGRMQQAAMRQDFSWDRSARAYEQIYTQAAS